MNFNPLNFLVAHSFLYVKIHHIKIEYNRIEKFPSFPITLFLLVGFKIEFFAIHLDITYLGTCHFTRDPGPSRTLPGGYFFLITSASIERSSYIKEVSTKSRKMLWHPRCKTAKAALTEKKYLKDGEKRSGVVGG